MFKYNTFLCFFIISVVAMIVFFVFYLQAIFGFAFSLNEMYRYHPNPFEFFSRIFTVPVIISGVIMAVASIIYRILGIVHVAKNKTAKMAKKLCGLWVLLLWDL